MASRRPPAAKKKKRASPKKRTLEDRWFRVQSFWAIKRVVPEPVRHEIARLLCLNKHLTRPYPAQLLTGKTMEGAERAILRWFFKPLPKDPWCHFLVETIDRGGGEWDIFDACVQNSYDDRFDVVRRDYVDPDDLLNSPWSYGGRSQSDGVNAFVTPWLRQREIAEAFKQWDREEQDYDARAKGHMKKLADDAHARVQAEMIEWSQPNPATSRSTHPMAKHPVKKVRPPKPAKPPRGDQFAGTSTLTVAGACTQGTVVVSGPRR